MLRSQDISPEDKSSYKRKWRILLYALVINELVH